MVETAFWVVMWCVAALAYFLPTLAAWDRKVEGVGGVAVVNLFLGWTVIGWVVALAWALGAKSGRKAR